MPEFGKDLGVLAEYVLGAAQWDASLNYPGNKEFVEQYTKMFGRPPDYHSASGYSGGAILEAAINKAGSLDRDKIRDALATLELTTLFGDYKVDDRGFQVAHKMVTLQWQDGELEVVWPKELATAKFLAPAPPWKDRPKQLGAAR